MLTKTHLAITLVRTRRWQVNTVAGTMEVALSNVKEQLKKIDKQKKIRYSKADYEWLLPMIRKVCDSGALRLLPGSSSRNFELC